MRKNLFSFLLVLFLLTGVSAQKSKPSKEEKRLRSHVAYLASEKLEGRKTGETGATYASGYIANKFAAYKLKPAASLNTFMQTFPFVTGVELSLKNQLSINNSKLNIKTDWMPVGFSANSDLPNVPVVFAGFGIAAAEQKYDSYDGIDIKNKIALVFEGTPDEGGPRSPFARFADARAKAKIAADKGAAGLILISAEEEFSKHKYAKLDYDQSLGEASIPVMIISRQAGAKLLGEKDLNSLNELEKWIAMRKDAPESIDIKLANRPKLNAQVTVDLPKNTAQGYNVIGVLEGRDAVLKNEAIIIGAHYDHLGRGGKSSLDPNSKDVHHGADDNASGVAAMLELARQFRKDKNNKRTIIFIAFGGEEEGLLGSKAYVNNPVFPLEKTIAMINMDMVGRLNENKLTIGGIGTAAEWNDLINTKNAKFPVKMIFAKTSSVGSSNGESDVSNFALQLNQDGFGPSDHSSFYGKQIPVLFFFTGTHSDYHKPSDTSDKINYRGLEKVTEFVGDIVRSIDQNPTRPTYTQAQSSGTMGGRSGGFNVSLGTVPGYADSANDGLSLDGVRDGSPAAKSGVKAGDKIIKLAGRDIKNISDYVFVLGEMKAGEEYEIVVVRGAETLTLKITPEARK